MIKKSGSGDTTFCAAHADWGNLGGGISTWGPLVDTEFDEKISTESYRLDAALRGLDDATANWMRSDIALLIARFSAITGATNLRVTLGPVRNDRCRKFEYNRRLMRGNRGAGPLHAR